jgi:DNA-binding transcriptional ArsR family regulator
MGFFDKRILMVLADGEPRDFQQILRKVDFSHNTLRLHRRRLVDQGLVIKEKSTLEGGSEDSSSPILYLLKLGANSPSLFQIPSYR